MKKTLLALALMTIWTGLSQAQGTFQNLDFESAQIIFNDPPYYKSIATTNALPDWSAFSGTTQLTNIPYGAGGIFAPVILYSQTNGGSLSGNYSVVLSHGGSGSGAPQAGSISQTGLVPADVLSLLFEVGTYFYSGPLTVSLGGQDLSYITISNALNYTLYGAAIPFSFAGQTETLTFTAGVNGGYAVAELDNIQFSTLSVPEPSAISLIFLGSGVLFYVRKRKSRVRPTEHRER
ncbi:MAG TPA: hypothetical protein DCQ92_05395 [Verrucomicrobia subdivision 3 bacterium]|nr:hypothetical protein [Limisphaerales bacterium]